MTNIEKWLSEYVNDPRFAKKLEALIEGLDEVQALKVRLSLIDYFVPKVKTVEASPEATDKTISINYVVPDAAHGKPPAVPAGRTDEPD